MKKVLFLITKGNFGGAQRYVFDLATSIPKGRFETVVGMGTGQVLAEKLKTAGVRALLIPSLKRDVGLFSDIAAFFALSKVITRENPDVVHLNSSKVGILGAVIVRIVNIFRPNNRLIKSVFTAHGWAFNEDRSAFSKCIILTLHWLTITLAHTTIAVSMRTHDQVAHLPLIKKKIVTIYNGIDPFEMKTESEARMALSRESTERIWIGTIAELHKNKGIDLVLEAFAPLMDRYANVIFVIIGSGEEEKSLRKLCSTLGVGHKVIFAGFREDARSYLPAFDIFTLTSRTEAFPYAPLEAGLAKLPVVASWVGGIPEVIENGISGILLDPRNTEMLTATLNDLIAKKDLRMSLGENLHKKVSEDFTLQNMIQKTVEVYGK